VTSSSSRRRDICYTIISRFEQALRKLIVNKVEILYGNFKAAIPEGIIQKVADRAETYKLKSLPDFLEETDFPDLKEILVYKKLYRYYLAPDILSQTEFVKMMDNLYIH